MTYWAVLFYIYCCALFKNRFFSATIIIILFILAAFIAADVSHDYQNYYNGYYLSDVMYFPEPLSRMIFNGANRLGLGISVSFVVFAVFSIYLKMKALKNLSLPLGLFFLIYFGKIYLLLDLTQVRASVSIALCLLGFDKYIKGKAFLPLLYIGLAFCFHISSIMFLVIYFVNKKKPNVVFWMSAMLAGFVFSFINIKSHLLSLLLLLHAPPNYFTYLDGTSDFTVNPLNALSIINVFIFLIFCTLKDVFTDVKMAVAFKLYGISIISFYVFIDFPVLSFRISEFFLIYQVVLLSGLVSFIKKEQCWLYTTLMLIFSCIQLYLTYNKAGVIESYSLSFF